MMIPLGCVEACPACRYRNFSAKESDAKKQAWVERCLSPLTAVKPIAHPVTRWGYRKKSLLHAELGATGWRLGLLKRRGWETDLIEIPDCPLHSLELNRAFRALKTQLDLMRDLPLAFVLASGGIFTLVLKCKENEKWRTWARSIEMFLKESGIESLQINWNPSAGRRPVSSRHQELIFGPRFSHDGEHFYGALSFRQQIAELETQAAKAAESFLVSYEKRRIIDLYSGSGPSLARWEKLGWECLGVELSGEAVEASKRNAPRSKILKGKVEQRIPQLNEWLSNGDSGFLLYTNPPRGGQGAEVNQWILHTRPAAIAYLSCNQKTLAEDLKSLSSVYKIHSVQPFDFFPQTDHVESLALLSLRDPISEQLHQVIFT